MSPLRVRYQTIEFGNTDIHLRTLRDCQQFSDPTGIAERLGISSSMWPIFGLIWPSSLVLSHIMLDYEFLNKSILDVGCGIGLSSILLNHLDANITATDHHPEVEGFLQHNTEMNNDKPIPFVLSDWNTPNTELKHYDIIIGSDLLYEDQHVPLLGDFISRHANKHCTVIIVDPGRGRHNKFSKKLADLGFSCTKSKLKDNSYLAKPFTGWVLEYRR